MKLVHKQNKKSKKEIEIIKKNLTNSGGDTVNEMKNAIKSFNSRHDQAEESHMHIVQCQVPGLIL